VEVAAAEAVMVVAAVVLEAVLLSEVAVVLGAAVVSEERVLPLRPEVPPDP
jgi:hypothetical protein